MDEHTHTDAAPSSTGAGLLSEHGLCCFPGALGGADLEASLPAATSSVQCLSCAFAIIPCRSHHLASSHADMCVTIPYLSVTTVTCVLASRHRQALHRMVRRQHERVEAALEAANGKPIGRPASVEYSSSALTAACCCWVCLN